MNEVVVWVRCISKEGSMEVVVVVKMMMVSRKR